jgi:hypothetical protein
MDDVGTYQIEVQGPVDELDLTTMSPLLLSAVQAGPASMRFTVRTDQSGLVGLIRYLHGRGLIFLSIQLDQSI